MKNILMLAFLLLVSCRSITGNENFQNCTWSKIDSPTDGAINSILINKDDDILIRTAIPGETYRLLHSHDTWDTLNIGGSYLNSTLKIGETFLYASGPSLVFFSNNNGNSWEAKPLFSILNQANTIELDNNENIYMGFALWGVFLSENFGNSWTPIGLRDKMIYTLCCSPANNIYAGTDSGLYVYQNKTGEWLKKTELPNIHSMAFIDTNTFYAGTFNQLYKLSNEGSSLDSLSIKGCSVNAILIDENNSIIIATHKGDSKQPQTVTGEVNISYDHGITWEPYGNNLPNVGIFSLAFDINKNVIAGTLNLGLYKLVLKR